MGLRRRRDLAAFWAWFATQAPGVLGPGDVDRAFLADLGRRLAGVDRHLEYEIGLRPATDEMELVVSAGGRDRVAPVVRDLVAAAPRLPGWRVTAFRPPRDVRGVAVRVHDEVVSEGDVWVGLSGTPPALVVTAHVRDLDRAAADRMRAAHLLLEQALGEQTLVEQVTGLVWRSFVGGPPPGLLPLAVVRASLPGSPAGPGVPSST